MSDNKKYYYIRLKENFFDSDAIVLMESMQDGYMYSNILMKMYLKSLKNNGKLMLNEYIPYDANMIATVTRHQVGTVDKALSIFESLGLIDKLDNGTVYMSDIELYIGTSSTEAERKRASRLNLNVNKQIGQMSDKRTPKKEIEKDKDKEKDKELEVIDKYFDDIELNSLFIEFLDMRKSMKAKNTERAIKLLLNDLNALDDDNERIYEINRSIKNSWKSIYRDKKQTNAKTKDALDWESL